MGKALSSPQEDFLADLVYSQPHSTITDGLSHHALVNNRGSPGKPKADERLTMEQLRDATAEGRAVFAVQTGVPIQAEPVRYPETGNIKYLELLLRLRQEDVCIGPSFFPVELWRDRDMMPAIFYHSLRTAVAMRTFMREHQAQFPIALNVNDPVLADSDFYDQFAQASDQDHTRPLVLEIHETLSTQVIKHSLDSLRDLVRQGVQIAIDDAPEHRSITNMHTILDAQIPIQFLKVSGKVIAGISASAAQQMQLVGIGATAQTLSIPQILVEGHEKFRMSDLKKAREIAAQFPSRQWLLQSPPPGQDTPTRRPPRSPKKES